MNDDYLWDKSGEPDADVARLEQVLGKLRWSGTPLNFARAKPAQWWQQRRWWAIAAVLMIGIGVTLVARRIQRAAGPVTSWQLSIAGGKADAVRAGQVIETAGKARGKMESEFVGEVDIEPNSRLRLLRARGDEQRMALDHGTIHALIWAPPTRFVVDTPSARTIDLGCQYTLHVSKDGAGFLTVETGWVAFQWQNIESFIPAGAACTTRPGHGPGTPRFLDAPAALTQALAQFDATGSSEALNRSLAAARPRDALTLWHLLQRTQGAERAQVFSRFAALVNLPPTVTREAILSGNRQSMDAAWNALQLGDTSWWREWKREW